MTTSRSGSHVHPAATSSTFDTKRILIILISPIAPITPYALTWQESAPAAATSSTFAPKDPKTREIIRTAVKSNFLFRHLDDFGVDAVISSMLPHPVKQGDAIIKQGDKGDYFYICQSGKYDVLIDRKVVHTYEVDEKEGGPAVTPSRPSHPLRPLRRLRPLHPFQRYAATYEVDENEVGSGGCSCPSSPLTMTRPAFTSLRRHHTLHDRYTTSPHVG